MIVKVGVRAHGQRPDDSVWGFWTGEDEEGHCRISHTLGRTQIERNDEDGLKLVSSLLKESFGPVFLPYVRLLRETGEDDAPLTGQFLYVSADHDFAPLAGAVAAVVSLHLCEETVIALASGLIGPLEVEIDLERYTLAKAAEKKEIKTTETVSVEMTVASDQFKVTLDKNGGEVRLQNREAQNTTFSIPKNKLDELIEVLTKVRDHYAPLCDKYGES